MSQLPVMNETNKIETQKTEIQIEAREINYSFLSNDQAITILQALNLSVLKGEKIAIIGRSGSGKSTLLSLLAGLDVPTQGKVQVEGQAFSALDEDGRASVRAKKMGFVFQSFQLLSSLTALENVMLPLQLNNQQDAKTMSLEALAQVGLSSRVHHYPKQLSGGEQQRVAIARAFVAKPAILFADEPTGNLDHATGQMIIDLLFSMNQQYDTTLVLVTHDRTFAERCQRAYALENGQLHEVTRV